MEELFIFGSSVKEIEVVGWEGSFGSSLVFWGLDFR